MGKSLLTAIVVCLFGAFMAVAQDNSSASGQNAQQPSYNQSTTSTTTAQSSSTDNSGQSSSTLPPSTQSAMSNGATQTSNGGEQTAEGCLIHEQTGYYVQPENGGARIQLSPSRSLDSDVGQHVRVSGQNGSSSDENSTAASSGGASDMGAGMLTVTRVQMISAKCSPASRPTQ